MQSFLWFHEHRMHHTGANVYKGMVGLFPMYDPGVPRPGNPNALLAGSGLDTGDETKGLRLPGVRVNNHVNDDLNQPLDGSFDVKYDIPMALYDLRLDDGVTPHADFRVGDALINGQLPLPVPPPVDATLCGAVHPEQWGKSFFRYHPNHGFVGDIFTVNCTAFPKLDVFQRRYRFRFLGASIARIYDLALMTSAADPVGRPGTQGQWQIPDGRFWRPMVQIASMGGLLPNPIFRNTIQIWPATRREVVVDFTGVPEGTVIYLTNLADMPTGRLPKFNQAGTSPRGLAPGRINALPYKVPMVKIVVGGPPPETDNSIMPVPPAVPNPNAPTLRRMPSIPGPAGLARLPQREFVLKRSGKFGDEAQWLINNLPFDPAVALTSLPGNPGNPGNIGNPKLNGVGEVWTVINGGGGWVHPMHMHQEEHTVLARTGSFNIHPDDTGKEDVVNLDPGEAVRFFRRFRTFLGPYVAHCHNLSHEDHNMMFGWKIDP
jgi:FtsP/CotA-like multicopper oxidase with cupredoxin domain